MNVSFFLATMRIDSRDSVGLNVLSVTQSRQCQSSTMYKDREHLQIFVHLTARPAPFPGCRPTSVVSGWAPASSYLRDCGRIRLRWILASNEWCSVGIASKVAQRVGVFLLRLTHFRAGCNRLVCRHGTVALCSNF